MRTAKTDQPGRIPRLIWVFTGRTLILLVLSCRGSFVAVWHRRRELRQEFHQQCPREHTQSVWKSASSKISVSLNYYSGWKEAGKSKRTIKTKSCKHVSDKFKNKCVTSFINFKRLSKIWMVTVCHKWAASWQNQQNGMCALRRLWSAKHVSDKFKNKCVTSFINFKRLSKIWMVTVCHKWAASWQNQQNGMCALRRLWSAWASAQSDHSLHCPHEESLGP